jgi:2-haloacid dehalogenase
MYKYLLFDADETLFDFLRAEKTALKLAFGDCNIPFKDEFVPIYSELNSKLWRRLERKEITKPELLARRFADLYEALGFADSDPELMREAYQRRLGEQCFLLPGALELVKKLSEDHKLYLITNGLKTTQSTRLSRSGLLPYLSGVFISEEVGCEKPDRKYFEKVKEAIPGFREEEALIIGDSLTSDILGGNNAGIKTVWFNPKCKRNETKAVPYYEIRKLEQIYEIL